jgi:hypothetical protein
LFPLFPTLVGRVYADIFSRQTGIQAAKAHGHAGALCAGLGARPLHTPSPSGSFEQGKTWEMVQLLALPSVCMR